MSIYDVPVKADVVGGWDWYHTSSLGIKAVFYVDNVTSMSC